MQSTPFGQFRTNSPCNVCNGSGKVIKSPCSKCDGKGKVRRKITKKVNIPAGINEGQTIPVDGAGSVGFRGGANGDLYVNVHIRPHQLFERRGTSVLCSIPITFVQAALGAKVVVPTLHGNVEMTVPEGTQPNTTFTLKGKGIPDINTKKKGDLIIKVIVETPRNLNNKQKELLLAFSESLGENNSGKKQKFFKKFFK